MSTYQVSPPRDPMRLYTTVTQLATRLGVTCETVRRWIRGGKLPAPSFQLGRTRYWNTRMIAAHCAANAYRQKGAQEGARIAAVVQRRK